MIVVPEQLDEEFAYWLGFLLADGCVYEPGRGKGSAVLKVTCIDKEHLEKLQGFLNSKHKLRQAKDCSWQLHIRSNELCNRLGEYGIHPRKSCIARVDDRLKDNRHFWRGLIDGDGWISWHKHRNTPIIGLCGSEDVCRAFQAYLLSLANFQSATKVRNKGSVHQYELGAKLARTAMRHLYNDCSIALDRKLTLVQEYTNE